MKKLIYHTLVALCLLVFANCRTTVKIDNLLTTQSVVKLEQQPLNINFTSTDLTREFIISFKNYLANEFQKKGIKAQLETTKEKLQTPYQLNLSIVDETKRRIGILFGAVYEFNGATITVELKNTVDKGNPDSFAKGGILRKNQVIVKHVYKSELTITARKAAEKLVTELNLTN